MKVNLLTKEGYKETEIKQHKSGLWYRIGSADEISIKECLSNYKNVFVKDKIVMDLGANMGGFSYMACKKGAKMVYSVEPDFYNFEMLKLNLKEFNNIELTNAAITDKICEKIDFYIGTGKAGPVMASLQPTRGRTKISVNNLFAKDYIERIQPEVMKIDIEGGEYDILKYIPQSCKELTIEWHCAAPRPLMLDLFNLHYNLFMKEGWIIIKEKKTEFFKDPKYYKSNDDFLKKTNGVPNFVMEGHYRR